MNTLLIFAAEYLFLVVGLGFLYLGIILPSKDRPLYFIQGIIAGISALILTKLAGALYYDPRPFTHGVHALIYHIADNGFPSDHSIFSFCLAFIAFSKNKKVGILLFILAILVAYARVAVGVHSPLDVVGGALIGLLAGSLGLIFGKIFYLKK